MKKEVLFKNSRNLKLFGIYYSPKTKNPPLVIFSHGFRVGASQSKTYKKLALFGSSLGGMTAILHTAKDKRIKYLYLKSPVSDFKKSIVNY